MTRIEIVELSKSFKHTVNGISLTLQSTFRDYSSLPTLQNLLDKKRSTAAARLVGRGGTHKHRTHAEGRLSGDLRLDRAGHGRVADGYVKDDVAAKINRRRTS